MAGREPNSQPLERTTARRRRRRRRIGARPIESTLRQLSAKTNIRPLITRAHCCCRRCCWLFNEGNITCSACWETFKGQLISKCLLGIFNSPKKRMKKFDSTTMVPQVEWFLFVFLGEFKTTKKPFRN